MTGTQEVRPDVGLGPVPFNIRYIYKYRYNRYKYKYRYRLDFGLGEHLKGEVDWPLDLVKITQL